MNESTLSSQWYNQVRELINPNDLEKFKQTFLVPLAQRNSDLIKYMFNQRFEERLNAIPQQPQFSEPKELLEWLEQTFAATESEFTSFFNDYYTEYDKSQIEKELLRFTEGLYHKLKSSEPENFRQIIKTLDSLIAELYKQGSANSEELYTVREEFLKVQEVLQQFLESANYEFTRKFGIPCPEPLVKYRQKVLGDLLIQIRRKSAQRSLENMQSRLSFTIPSLYSAFSTQSSFPPSVNTSLVALLYMTNAKPTPATYQLMDSALQYFGVTDSDISEVMQAQYNGEDFNNYAEAWLKATNPEQRVACIATVVTLFTQDIQKYEAWRREWIRNWIHAAFERKYEALLGLNETEFKLVIEIEHLLYKELEKQGKIWVDPPPHINLQINSPPDPQQKLQFFKKLANTWKSKGDLTTSPSLECINDRKSLHTIVAVSGWLSQEDELKTSWREVASLGSKAYWLRWESGTVSDYLELSCEDQGFKVNNARKAIYCMLYEHNFKHCIKRAEKTGVLLAQAIENGELGHAAVSLVGFSLGTRVILHCLQELHRLQSDRIHDVVLLGGAAPISPKEDWVTAREVVNGRLINVYSKQDRVLSMIYSMSEFNRAIGSQPLDVKGIENYDATEYIEGHMNYRAKLDTVFHHIKFNF